MISLALIFFVLEPYYFFNLTVVQARVAVGHRDTWELYVYFNINADSWIPESTENPGASTSLEKLSHLLPYSTQGKYHPKYNDTLAYARKEIYFMTFILCSFGGINTLSSELQ